MPLLSAGDLSGIRGALAGKTRLVVMSSHQDLAREADVLITIDNGRVASVVHQAVSIGRTTAPATPAAPAGTGMRDKAGELAGERTESNSNSNSNSNTAHDEAGQNDKAQADTTAGAGLTVTETKQQGAVSWQVYKSYAAAASVPTASYDAAQLTGSDRSEKGGYAWLARPKEHGAWVVAGVLLVYVFGQTVRVMSDVWLTWWAADEDEESTDLPPTLVRIQPTNTACTHARTRHVHTQRERERDMYTYARTHAHAHML